MAKGPTKTITKTAMWRRLAKKTYEGSTEIRNGRHIRNQIIDFGKLKYPHQLVISLLKSGGISTPKFDEMQSRLYNNVLTTGEPNAA